MKHILAIIAVLASFNAAATTPPTPPHEVRCTSSGIPSIIVLADGVLMDDMERLIATEIHTGIFESIDEYGKVTYTIHGNNIIMKGNGFTKEYVCDL